jgi:parvulin-like peptidyl-prolyl isomerase
MKRLATTVAILSVFAYGASARADILEQILVKVNGDIITKTELEQRQIAALRQRDPNFRPDNDTELRQALIDVTPEVIVNAVDELLLVQRGRELGYALGNEQFRSIIENIKKENNLDTEESFQAALKQEGLTLDDLRRQLERQMLVSRVQQVEVAGKIAVAEEEVKRFYEESKDSFTTQPQLTLREILIVVPTSEKGLNVAQDDAARERAEQIRTRIDAGESFEALVAEASESASKANAGLIGPISRSDLSPELLKEVDAIKPGQVTRVMRTTRGYHIIKLESATPVKVKTLDEARAEIADKVAEQKHRGQMTQYLRQLREQAIIDWKNDEVKRAWDVGVQKQQQEAAALPSPTASNR